MIITIEDKQFDTKDITQLYPAAVVKTGHEDETTQMSLEWIDLESKGKVEIVGYGVFVNLGEEEKYSFVFDTREEMDTDTDVENILMKYLKQREDAKIQFSDAGRNDLVEKEDAEIAIVKVYLPEPMNDEELESVLKGVIASVDAQSMKDMGKVMGAAKSAIGSRADGGRINQMVKKLLS